MTSQIKSPISEFAGATERPFHNLARQYDLMAKGCRSLGLTSSEDDFDGYRQDALKGKIEAWPIVDAIDYDYRNGHDGKAAATLLIEALVNDALTAVNSYDPNKDAKPVAWRWRAPGATIWIYDPSPDWLEAHRHEVDAEPLYAHPPSDNAAAFEAKALTVCNLLASTPPKDWQLRSEIHAALRDMGFPALAGKVQP